MCVFVHVMVALGNWPPGGGGQLVVFRRCRSILRQYLYCPVSPHGPAWGFIGVRNCSSKRSVMRNEREQGNNHAHEDCLRRTIVQRQLWDIGLPRAFPCPRSASNLSFVSVQGCFCGAYTYSLPVHGPAEDSSRIGSYNLVKGGSLLPDEL